MALPPEAYEENGNLYYRIRKEDWSGSSIVARFGLEQSAKRYAELRKVNREIDWCSLCPGDSIRIPNGWKKEEIP
jgi:hypothetical protein